MNTRYFYLMRFALAGCDLLLVNICFYLGFYLSDTYGAFEQQGIYSTNALVCSLGWLLCAQVFSLYSEATVHKYSLVKQATLRTLIMHTLTLWVYLLFKNYEPFPTTFLAFYIVGMFLVFLASRVAGKAALRLLNRKFDFRKAVAVLNIGKGGAKLAAYLNKQRTLNFIGFLSLGNGKSSSEAGMRASNAAEQFRAAADSGIEEVYVSVDPSQIEEYSYLIEESDKQCMRLKFVPDLSIFEDNYAVNNMGDFKVLSPRKEPLELLTNRLAKRVFDLIVSLLTIIFILSWLFPLLALLIKLESRGPILYKQLRSGRDNKPFCCYKFRSMYSGVYEGTDKQSQVTPLGRFLRRTSLDEFPQFLNVLFGYMTIIGPRPHMISDTEDYRKRIDTYMVRQFVKPGISGWAQVNGYRGQTMHTDQMAKRVEHDIWYMENWCMLLDAKIVLLTIKNIFKGEENAF